MRLIYLDEPLDLPNPIVTIGQFDGVHLGHASVFETVRLEATSRCGTSIAITFNPHPRTVIDEAKTLGILTSLEEKIWRLEPLGIDFLAIIPFDSSFRNLSPKMFVESYLVQKLSVRTVVMGYNHGFGKDRIGGLDTMRSLGQKFRFDVISVPPTLIEGELVSSTRVRQLVSEGDMEGVRGFLGRGYPIVGEVIRGKSRGRKLGFPTANLKLDEPTKLLPPDGVYAAWVYLPERHKAVLNLGFRPTFQEKTRSLEVHLIDFNGDLYGKSLRVALCRRIRPEVQFKNQKELEKQIQHDLDAARQTLSCKNRTL